MYAALPHRHFAAQIPPSAQEIGIAAKKAAKTAICTTTVKNVAGPPEDRLSCHYRQPKHG